MTAFVIDKEKYIESRGLIYVCSMDTTQGQKEKRRSTCHEKMQCCKWTLTPVCENLRKWKVSMPMVSPKLQPECEETDALHIFNSP